MNASVNRETMRAALLFAAVFAVVGSFWVPSGLGGRSNWSESSAARYRELSGDLHAMAYRTPSAKNDAELAEAQREFASLTSDLESARTGGERVAFALRVLGGVAIAASFALRRKGTGKRR